MGCRSVQRERGWGAGPWAVLILGKWGGRARVSQGFCCDPALLPSPAALASADQRQRGHSQRSEGASWYALVRHVCRTDYRCECGSRLTCERAMGPASYRPSPLPPLSSSACCCCCSCLETQSPTQISCLSGLPGPSLQG